MGLGKTFQVTSFLAGLANVNSKMTALIVVPVSLISTWEDTLNEYMPVMCGICVLHGAVTGKKEDALRKIRADGGVCITTYGAISADGDVAKLVGSHSSIESTVQWSVVVMDEANKVKNPSAMVQVCDAARQLRADAKLLLTGTPIQNNLEELWALFDIACNGKLFGERALFSAQYRHPIERGQDKRASKEDIMRGKQLTQKLRDVFEPHFLRRDKAAMQALMKESGVEMKLGSIGNMPQKHELIIWTKLSDVQLEAYKAFLESDQVKALLGSTESPLIAINVLRKICAHTLLLSSKTPTSEVEDDDAQQRITAIAGGNFKTVDDMVADAERLTAMSCKMQFLLQLLHSFKEEGHRALVFSQSVLMLDIVEAILRQQSLSYSRLDGSIVNPKKRHAIVQEFNADASKLVCLLSKGVGATGLTLTGADRVVILDPDWNPAVDAQSVDRAYRIGQTRPVVTYRLVTCGTIEEAIYRRQVFKSGLTNSVMRKDKAGKGERYMSDSDLRDCFKLGDIHRPVTKTLLESVSTDSASASGSECESPHFIALELQAATSHCYAGISYHHKLFKPAAATTTRRQVTLSDEQLQLQPATKKKRARKARRQEELAVKYGITAEYEEWLHSVLDKPGESKINPKAAQEAEAARQAQIAAAAAASGMCAGVFSQLDYGSFHLRLCTFVCCFSFDRLSRRSETYASRSGGKAYCRGSRSKANRKRSRGEAHR